MMKNIKIVFTIALNVIYFSVYTQSYPAEKDTVHYLHVFFADSIVKDAANYELRLFTDSNAMRKRDHFYADTNHVPAFHGPRLDWGKTYGWQVISRDKRNKVIYRSPFHSFSVTEKLRSLSFDETRIDVMRNYENKHAGGYLAIDYLKGIFDRNGQPVWVLPHIPGVSEASTQIRDLKFTGENTLTFLSNNTPVEIDLHGRVLWSLPEPYVHKEDTIIFHHDFRKTKQGTYLALGNRKVNRKITGYDESSAAMKREFHVIDGNKHIKVDIPVVFEFSAEGKLLWYWDANPYLKDEDLNFRRTPDGFPILYPHANAIGVNDSNTRVYLGFRDISRIIRIDKKSGTVDLSYGEKYPSGEARFANGLFLQQHDAKVTAHNSILVFNNNGARRGGRGYSSILELRDNITDNDSVLLWKFELNFDTLSSGRSKAGGNVNELPNTNILLCGGQLNRIFEVTRQKEVVWDGFIFARGKNDTLWQPMPNYRCSWTKDVSPGFIFTGNVEKRKKKDQFGIIVPVVNVNALDRFHFSVFDRDGKMLHQGTSAVLKQFEQYDFHFSVPVDHADKASCQIRISSEREPTLVKTITIQL